MKIGFGCDHAAIDLKNELVEYMKEKGYECVDYGTGYDENGEIIKCDYPAKGEEVGCAVVNGDVDYGVLMCGTGIGMAIAACKISGVRAANIVSSEFAKLCREHNDANVITLSGRFVPLEENEKILDVFFATEFGGGRHAGRVAKINALDS